MSTSFERNVLDALGRAVVVTDTEGTIVYMNTAAEELYGYQSGEAVGKPGSDLLVPGSAGMKGRTIREQVTSGLTSSERILLRRKDGSTFPARMEASPIHDESGKVSGLVGITQDITEDIRAEQNLFSEKEVTEALLSAIPDLIFHIGRNGEYRYVHAKQPGLLVRPAGEMVGHRLQDVMETETADRWMRAINHAINQKTTSRLEYTVQTVAGDERTFEGHLAPLYDDGVVAIARDITERKKIQRSLQSERDRFREIIRAAPVFMAVLRGPDHVFEFVNDHYYELVGERDLIGRTVLEALPEVEGQGFIPLLDRVYETGKPFVGKEIPAMVRTNSQLAPAEHILDLNYIALRDENGDATGILAHGVDVTDAVKAKRRLVIQNEIHRATLNARSARQTAGAMLKQLNEFLPLSRAAVLLFSDDSKKVVPVAEVSETRTEGFNFWDITDRDSLLDTYFSRESSTGHFTDLEKLAESWAPANQLLKEGLGALLSIQLNDGQSCVGVVLLAAPKPFREEHVDLAVEAAESLAIAFRSLRMVEEIEEARVRLEAVNLQLVQAQEQERRALALELHDEVGQVLTSVLFALHDVDDSTVPEHTLGSLERARSIVMELAGQIRSLSLDLRPPMLDDFGLKSTLEWYREKFTAETGVKIQLSTAGLSGDMLPETVRTTAFRVIQEALTNVARYADVTEVSVKALRRDDRLLLRVRDMGEGFDVEDMRTRHVGGGLSGMVERVRLLEGELSIESDRDDGTTIIAVIPIPS